jgi:hypothetical protein
MSTTYLSVKRFVVKALSKDVYDDILSYLMENPPNLWGEQQLSGFFEKMVTLGLFKELKSIGYKKLNSDVDIGSKLNHKSFQHNWGVIRKEIAKWAESTIDLGTAEDWDEAVEDVALPKEFENVNLWMDSTDFPKQRHKGGSRKDPDWSYKLNKPGRRFMFIRDGKGLIRKVWGGYSPKLYDGDFLDLMKGYLKEELNGAGIIADQHFDVGKKYLPSIKFFTPIKEPTTGKRKKRAESISKLTKEQVKWNKHLHALRARIESPFGIIKNLWKSLSKPWEEDDSALDALVWIAVGVYNKKTQQ